jgi:hypothetical protein
VKRSFVFQRFSTVMTLNRAATIAVAALLTSCLNLQVAQAAPLHSSNLRSRAAAFTRAHPWVEGVDPALENRLFDATYRVLPKHNLLKVYVFDAGGFESAGIRFSARVPHAAADLTDSELDHEAATLIRTTFERFPDVQLVDVWATIPVSAAQATEVESTLFSVSADRRTFQAISDDEAMSDDAFLAAFGRVWVAPQVPQ